MGKIITWNSFSLLQTLGMELLSGGCQFKIGLICFQSWAYHQGRLHGGSHGDDWNVLWSLVSTTWTNQTNEVSFKRFKNNNSFAIRDLTFFWRGRVESKGVYEIYLRYGGGIWKVLYSTSKGGCMKNNPLSCDIVQLLIHRNAKNEGGLWKLIYWLLEGDV